jgi:hypothetical protein
MNETKIPHDKILINAVFTEIVIKVKCNEAIWYGYPCLCIPPCDFLQAHYMKMPSENIYYLKTFQRLDSVSILR